MRHSTAIHEAGHAVVATHFLGQCVYGVMADESGATLQLSLAGAQPSVAGAIAVAGALAERLFVGDPGDLSGHDAQLLETAYLDWAGGTRIELERLAFERSTVQLARAVLLARAAAVHEVARSLVDTGDVPRAYWGKLRIEEEQLAQIGSRISALRATLAGKAPERKSYLEVLRGQAWEDAMGRAQLVYRLSGPSIPRAGV